MTEATTGGIKLLPVSILLLDNLNPRLPPDAISMSQQELYLIFERDFDLFPIARSMVDNGYFQEEPLIGIPGSNGKIIVVEGNRRLAVLKFLTDPEVRNLSKKKNEWDALYEKAKKKGHDLTKVPVVVHKNREELRSILGFRHITGILKWDALSKARFINNLIEGRKGATFSDVAREVGSRVDTIRNNYVAYRVYKQAKEDFDIDTSKVEVRFGVFYTALNNPNIREYIGLKRDQSIEKLKKPIRKSKADELKNFIELLHGTSEVSPVFTDSRNISKLGEILAVPEARKILLTTQDFDLAYRSTGGERRTLIDNLEKASISLTEAYKTAYLYCKDPKVKKLIERCAATIRQILRSCNLIRETSSDE